MIVLATSATAWPSAVYGALVIWSAGDFSRTGSQWLFGWPFLLQLLVANTLHLLAMGFGARWGVRPWYPELATLDAVAARREQLATLDAAVLRRALHAVVRFPVWNDTVGFVLSLLVVASAATLERCVGGADSPNVWVIVRAGVYALALYATAGIALSELLTRPFCRELRQAAANAGLDPYDGFAISTRRRIGAMVVPTVIALLVAVEIGRVPDAGSGAYAALIVSSALLAFGLSVLQYENGRSAVRELGAACRALGAGGDGTLVTGSTDALLLEMASEFTQAARRVGAARRASGERHRALFEAAFDCIVTMDHEGRIVEFNPAAERTFGRARADVIGTELGEALVPTTARGPHRRGLARYLATGEGPVLGQRIEVNALRADGSEFPIELAVTRLPGEGLPVFTGFARDITDRKRAEAALTASQRLAEEEAEIAAALLHVGQTLSAHLDQPDLLERVNRLAVEMLGCDWSSTYIWDERRQSLRLQANVGSPAAVLAEVERTEFKSPEFPLVDAIRRGELVEVPSPTGEPMVPAWLLERWAVGPMLGAPIVRSHEVVGLLLNGYRERTGEYSAKQRRLALGIAQATAIALGNARLIGDLQAASRVKSEFLSTMSHELRTPLNVVLGYVEMARDDRLAGDDRRRALERVDAAGRDLLQLIESTLEIGRIEAGRDEVQLAAIPVTAFWNELGAACSRLPRADGVRLDWRPAPADVDLASDPRKLTVIVRNLIGNALKFTEEGSVSASLSVDDDWVLLEVADTGIGIRPEDQETVFEMFRQADGSDSRRHGGTGLGLYLVRRFVQQLGGTVVLESRAGEGSRFRIRLPRTPPMSAALPLRATA